MGNKAKYVVPASDKRIQHEQIKQERKVAKPPAKIDLDAVYRQNEIIISNQEYIIELLRKRP